MNKYKVIPDFPELNSPLERKETECSVCKKYVARSSDAFFVKLECKEYYGYEEKYLVCSEECANMYILSDMDNPKLTGFEKFIFPMVRLMYPNLVAQELVNVQPMQTSISNIFFKDKDD